MIPVKIVNKDCKEGYLPLVDAGEGIIIGQAAVASEDGHCHVMAINVGYEDIDIQIAPQTIVPYDIYDIDSDKSDSDGELEKITGERVGRRLSKRQGVNRICELVGVQNLAPDGKESIIELLKEFPGLFFLPGDEFPGITLEQHTIPTTDDVPLVTKHYRYPPVHKEEIRKQIRKLLELGVIKKSNSPLWIVPKKADTD